MSVRTPTKAEAKACMAGSDNPHLMMLLMAVCVGAYAGGVAGQLPWGYIGEIGGQVAGGLVGGIAWAIWLSMSRSQEPRL